MIDEFWSCQKHTAIGNHPSGCPKGHQEWEALSKQFIIHKQHNSNLFSLEIKGIPFSCSREEVAFLQTLLANILRENPAADQPSY